MTKRDKQETKIYFSKQSVIILGIAFVVIILGAIHIAISEKQPTEPVDAYHPRPVSAVEITHGDTSKRQVIFTFDFGSSNQSGKQIMDALAKHGVKGTFFMTGQFVELYPDFTKEVLLKGHEIFNHTYSHPYLTFLTRDEIVGELRKMELVMSSTTQTSTKPFFRAPYADRDSRVINIAAEEGYESVYWTVDARDWEESEGMTAPQVTDRILSSLSPGAIYLMHAGDNITGAILDEVFTKIKDRGYNIVSLTQGL